MVKITQKEILASISLGHVRFQSPLGSSTCFLNQHPASLFFYLHGPCSKERAWERFRYEYILCELPPKYYMFMNKSFSTAGL